MTDDLYVYEKWVSEALQGVLKTALNQLAASGFTGEHHFYINFDTSHDGVRMPGFLRAQYPEEITIVLQHQFQDLVVEDDAFDVTLSFNGQKQHLHIPYDAVNSFADPSVNLGLQIGLSDIGQNKPASAAEAGVKLAEVPSLDIEGSTWKTGTIGEIDRSELDIPAPSAAELDAVLEDGSKIDDEDAAPEISADIITLDQFRKKNS